MELEGKHIVLGISGSIAAYKACALIRMLTKDGAEVQVVITPSGKEFITSTTLSALTRKPVISEFFDSRDGSWHSHVDLGIWADAMVIAPATASSIGKMANGIADNMLITTYLSMKAPVIIAPAMDLDMWKHPSTQCNLKALREYGNVIVEPKDGMLASSLVGKGRMEEPEKIIQFIRSVIGNRSSLKGKSVLITAGPTYEKIDPVRFIGNYSSGKMGYCLAEECALRGAKVELISGPTSLETTHPDIHCTHVVTTEEMYEATIAHYPTCDVGILCAAVADFTPELHNNEKIKREEGRQTLNLLPTPDIAAALGKMKRNQQVLVGFALETNDEESNARHKLEKKNFDFIVLNSLRDKGAGFLYDTNKITILSRNGRKPYRLKSKREVAKDIIDNICDICG